MHFPLLFLTSTSRYISIFSLPFSFTLLLTVRMQVKMPRQPTLRTSYSSYTVCYIPSLRNNPLIFYRPFKTYCASLTLFPVAPVPNISRSFSVYCLDFTAHTVLCLQTFLSRLIKELDIDLTMTEQLSAVQDIQTHVCPTIFYFLPLYSRTLSCRSSSHILMLWHTSPRSTHTLDASIQLTAHTFSENLDIGVLLILPFFTRQAPLFSISSSFAA